MVFKWQYQEPIQKRYWTACSRSSNSSLVPFGDQAVGGTPAFFRVASQYLLIDEVVDVLLGCFSGALGYTGPFGGGEVTVVKMVDFSGKLLSAISEDAVCAAPPPQQCKAAPPGNPTREHRSGPRSGRSPNRIGTAHTLPQPVLRCKRRSQLSRDHPPQRPHVLHTLPCRYGEGDLNAIAHGSNP